MKHFDKSMAYLARAEQVIPLGSQTFSKSRTQYPYGASPYFIAKGSGSKVWDIDGNEYIDFINGLASITLGYQDPDVTAGVHAQISEGVIFSLPHPIETEVAEMICELVPSAEMVRFGKNGSDATAGAVRLARAFTDRERVAVCGYHGWQDWYIGSTARHRGVPQATRELTHSFAYNDLDSLEAVLGKHPREFAAVILEPMNVAMPQPGFLEGVKAAAHQHGALLIFDETITGFRFHDGGAQALFNVLPDLSTFGKGLANGYPVSAIAGRRDVMKLMEEIFFSFTFGGECLSLAAAKATLAKLRREAVCAGLARKGVRLQAGLHELIESHGLQTLFSVSGHPSWTFLNIKDGQHHGMFDIKTLFMQEMIERGVLTFGTFNLSHAHSDADIEALLQALGEVLPLIQEADRAQTLKSTLRCTPLQPLFKVR